MTYHEIESYIELCIESVVLRPAVASNMDPECTASDFQAYSDAHRLVATSDRTASDLGLIMAFSPPRNCTFFRALLAVSMAKATRGRE